MTSANFLVQTHKETNTLLDALKLLLKIHFQIKDLTIKHLLHLKIRIKLGYLDSYIRRN